MNPSELWRPVSTAPARSDSSRFMAYHRDYGLCIAHWAKDPPDVIFFTAIAWPDNKLFELMPEGAVGWQRDMQGFEAWMPLPDRPNAERLAA